MDNLRLGILAGLLLALVSLIGGFGGFVLAVVFAAVGGAIGAQADGVIDFRALWRDAGRD